MNERFLPDEYFDLIPGQPEDPSPQDPVRRDDRKTVDRNVIVNGYEDGRMEVIFYRNTFKVPKSGTVEGMEHPRRFIELQLDPNNKQKTLIPLFESTKIRDLEKTIFQSSKRACDNFYGYALANKWDYFATLTFSCEMVDRYDDEAVKFVWVAFRRALQSFDPRIRILAVPERHEDNALHFHVLLGTSQVFPIVYYDREIPDTFDKQGRYAYLPKSKYRHFLVPYINKGRQSFSKSGAPLFCMSSYTWGRNSWAILDPNLPDYIVANYLAKYLTKQSGIGYNKKRYYRTNNLKFKNKGVFLYDADELERDMFFFGLRPYKSTAKFVVFRNFNVDPDNKGK